MIGRRADGYHLLDSLVVFADVGDTVTAASADSLSLQVTGPFAGGLVLEQDNLVLRAARGLAEVAGVEQRGRLVLDKQLPVASGIGGGSADAAATLRALQRLWDIVPTPATLAALALRLGADVPVCLQSRATRMGGVGEILQPAPSLPPCGVLLVNPGVGLPTVSVFRARASEFSARADLPDGWADASAMAEDLRRWGNDLENPARRLCPAIAEVLAWIAARPGCLLARMSGSGATCFGLFRDPAGATLAAAETVPPGWWVRAGSLLRD